MNDEMCANGLSMARAKVLGVLVSEGPTRQAALAAQLGLAPRSVTDAIDGLERSGYAVRRDDPTDRRARLVEVTADGRTMWATNTEIKHRMLERIFGDLDDEARELFLSLLVRINTAVTTIAGDGPRGDTWECPPA
jgi:DNA-binding MarR family transcriptional regulator